MPNITLNIDEEENSVNCFTAHLYCCIPISVYNICGDIVNEKIYVRIENSN